MAEDSGSEDTKSEEIKEKKKTPDLQASPSLHDSLHDIEKTANKSADKGVTSSKTKTDASGSLKKKSKRYLIIIAFVLLVAAPFVWFWQFIPANQEGMMSRIKHFVQERFSDNLWFSDEDEEPNQSIDQKIIKVETTEKNPVLSEESVSSNNIATSFDSNEPYSLSENQEESFHLRDQPGVIIVEFPESSKITPSAINESSDSAKYLEALEDRLAALEKNVALSDQNTRSLSETIRTEMEQHITRSISEIRAEILKETRQHLAHDISGEVTREDMERYLQTTQAPLKKGLAHLEILTANYDFIFPFFSLAEAVHNGRPYRQEIQKLEAGILGSPPALLLVAADRGIVPTAELRKRFYRIAHKIRKEVPAPQSTRGFFSVIRQLFQKFFVHMPTKNELSAMNEDAPTVIVIKAAEALANNALEQAVVLVKRLPPSYPEITVWLSYAEESLNAKKALNELQIHLFPPVIRSSLPVESQR